ncbi:MAG: PTS IIA-like nitrogen regulatory protein PtsN [Rubrimonas sp.]|uniref:PTS IIA-like nitrogen regulatory protein PtsN n=1 Tax=Rubrimonas sp. TaxID=2036015 RepID=UPI002FDE99AF
MEIRDILAPEGVAAHQRATSKKQLFQEIANRAAECCGTKARDVFDALNERERLGSTALGRGVAAPHARLAGLDRISGLFLRLEKPIEFDALDDEPVDLVFALFAPEDAGADHLRALARVSRALRDPTTCAKLRSCGDASAIYAVLTESVSSRAA